MGLRQEGRDLRGSLGGTYSTQRVVRILKQLPEEAREVNGITT